MTEQANAAMDALKTNRILEENIFPLDRKNLPNSTHADPFGKIMVHSPVTGWHIIDIDFIQRPETETCDYWTFCPPTPPPISNHD